MTCCVDGRQFSCYTGCRCLVFVYNVLSNRLLVELADVLAAPVCALINTSIRHGIVPSQWKTARVVPIPKLNPPMLVESDLRTISITSVSKVV